MNQYKQIVGLIRPNKDSSASTIYLYKLLPNRGYIVNNKYYRFKKDIKQEHTIINNTFKSQIIIDN